MHRRVSTDTLVFTSAKTIDDRGYYSWLQIAYLYIPGLLVHKSKWRYNEIEFDHNSKLNFVRRYPAI